MSSRVLLASFDHEHDLLEAVAAVRRRNLTIIDAFCPYAVHGLDRAMGLRPSRLTWICFAFGMLGAVGMLWFEHWSASVDWALDVGGKPWNSLPSDVPVAFEAAILLAGFSSVFALLAVSHLYPGKQSSVVDPRVTDDRFVLVIEQSDAAFGVDDALRLLADFHVRDVNEKLVTKKGLV